MFQLFPGKIGNTGEENRILLRERLNEVIPDNLQQKYFRSIFAVYSQWLMTKNGDGVKQSISTVRINSPKIYREIMEAQAHRCAYCGFLFGDVITGEQQLDHILPFRLGGDLPCGSNWQILCKDCNFSKKDMFSIFQHRVANDWIYHLKGWSPIQENRAGKKPISFAVITRDKKCMNCNAGPMTEQLRAINLTAGLSIPSNMVTVCTDYPDCEVIV